MSNCFKDKARYNHEWKDPWLYPQISQWIQSVNTGCLDDVFCIKCKLCKEAKMFLSNMEIATSKKHMTDPNPDKYCKPNTRMEDLKSVKGGFFGSTQSDNEPPTSSVACSETVVQSSNKSLVQSELKTIPDEVWQSHTL